MRRPYDLDANAWVRRAADMRSNHVEPGSLAPAKGLWSSPPPKRKFTTKQLGIITGVMLVGFGIATFFFRITPVLFSALMLPLQALFAIGGTGGHVATKQDRRLVEDVDDANVCLVGVTVRRDGKRVGEDRGVVWFSEGALFYNGHRTSFVLGGQDVVPHDEFTRIRRGRSKEELPDRMVALRHPDGEVVLEIVPLTSSGSGTGSPSEMRFLKRFYEFRRRPVHADVARQWPPLEV